MKQTICTLIVLAALVTAAGVVETHTLVSLGLLGVIAAAAYFGRLDKRRVSVEEIERRWGNAKN